MNRLARPALAVALLALLGARTGLRSAPLPTAEPRVVAFELNNNHVVMPVEWQGRRLSFLLDTGAGGSFLDLGRARAAGLRLASQFAATGAGPGSSAAGVLQRPITVTIPGEPDGVTAQVGAVLDLADIAAHAGRDIDGVIGADFIRQFVLEIDYEHRRLRLHDPGAFTYTGLGIVVPLTFKNQFPMVRAALRLPDESSLAVSCILDVGSSLAVGITQPVAERNRLAERLQATEPMSVGRGAGGATQSRVARLPEIAIGAVRVANPVATLAQAGSGVMSSGTLFDVNIGGGVMRRFTMVFDYGRSQVIFEPNGATG
jgi:predicted aspartyl protease